MSQRTEDETDFSLKAVSRGGVKQNAGKPGSEKAVSSEKGCTRADAVPSGWKPNREENQESSPKPSSTNKQYSYNFNSERCGTCIIFNNMQFDERTGQAIRKGSDLDAVKMKETFEMFGFDVKTYTDCTCMEMWSVMNGESSRDHSEEDCFVCVILSHGARGVDYDAGVAKERDIIYGKDNFMDLSDITRHVIDETCPTLAGKPKIFIVQACRGFDLSEGVEFEEVTWSSGDTEIRPTMTGPQPATSRGYDEADAVSCGPQNSVPQTVPIDIDYLLVYSAPPGFFSFRSKDKGSFFITAICDQLQRFHADKDLMSIMTRVNHQVAFLFESYALSTRNNPRTRDIHEKKQMPWVASQLTKFVHFTKKES